MGLEIVKNKLSKYIKLRKRVVILLLYQDYQSLCWKKLVLFSWHFESMTARVEKDHLFFM